MAKILVIDDDAPFRRMMLQALEDANHTVLGAENGRKGLALLKEHRPDLIITDVIMPEKEGLETVIEALKTSPGIKIIVMSGGGMSHNMMFLDIARTLGAHATLAKPFRIEELLAAIERLLPGRDPSPTRKV
jgi:CheY-like chemotaxis protein